MRHRSIFIGIVFALSLAACSPADDDGAQSDAGTEADQSTTDVVAGETLEIVRILDETGANCMPAEELMDPGADIFAVGLETESGAPLAWGSVVWDGVVSENNEFADVAPIDGTPLELPNGENCPETLSDSTIVSLGCSGSIYVEFYEPGSSEPVPLTVASRYRVRVYEADRQCRPDTSDDSYSVAVCSDRAAIEAQGDPASCDVPLLTEVSGERFAPLQNF